MKRTRTLVIALWAVFVNQVAFSQKGTEEQLVKDANTYFKSGEYLKAFPLYSQLVSLYPNHADYNYRFGACAIYSESDKTKAVRYLNQAVNKGVEDPMAYYYLGKAYHLNYQFKDAIKAYESFIRNADPKVSAKTDAQRQVETCIYGSNLLANIKDISVISKTEADKANFFRYFNLEGIGGKILTIPDELKTKVDLKSKEPGVIHYPGNSTTIYFASFGKDGSTGKDIYKAQILPDGKFSTPEKIEGDVNTPYDEDFCFMHSDGKTLYFASKGHNSMGGYDIFKSVYDPKDQKFGPAINLDFAINTPDDDIFYIADSLNKQAYFASGRASDLEHLNVYNVMVESIPLQVVYIKGQFISEINEEQKKAGIKINETGTGRMVCDGMTNTNSGTYMMYVPKSGEYNFKVITENSATVHDVKVAVPIFDKPVALRQEMRLVSENGQDKLIVTNYFDTPLEEDLSALAAEMLRKKSNLDVNTTAPTEIASAPTRNTSGGELSTYEKTIDNATLAAGFTAGTTLNDVANGMQKEVESINRFVAEGDQKKINSLAYALKKQKEADAALTEAESIRKNIGTISTDSDIQQMRKSVELADKAEELQREAKAAFNSSSSIEQYKASEADRAAALNAQITTIKNAESQNNYDAAVQALTQEKDRQTMMRDGQSGSPYAEMIAKAKARESEQSREEQKLAQLREREKSLNGDVKTAEANLAAAKKDKEKQAAQNALAASNTELQNTRNQITQQQQKVEKANAEAKMAYANATYFQQISDNTNCGLTQSDMVNLNETERTKLAMRIDELQNRVVALEIKDPQMLAMITDNGASASGGVTASNGATKSAGSSTNASATNNPVGDSNSIGATANISAQTASNGSTASNIRSKQDAQIKRLSGDAKLAPAQRMFTAQSIRETDAAIYALELKKDNGSITASEENTLNELRALSSELSASMSNTSTPSSTQEDARATYASVAPDYNEQVQTINNTGNSEIEKAVNLIAYKKETLAKLQSARLANATAAAGETDNSKLAEYASKDQKLEAAITTLYNEASDVNQIKAAYETENKNVIESDAVYAAKLEKQIGITESYINALDGMVADKEKEMMTTSNPVFDASIEAQIAAINEEQALAEAKLDNYKNDLQLTASASDPSVATNLEDALSASVTAEVAETEEVDNTPQIEKDVVVIEKMFKPREEAESIFAYESGLFEEIVAQHQNGDAQLKNREKIQEYNDNIFLIEAEMENEPNQSKLRKLDYKAEQMYLKRSLIEIDNAPSIAKMTRAEYDEELSKSNEMVGMNQEKVDSKIMIRDEVKRLKREAEYNMNSAGELRAQAPAIEDDIERADYYRRAFAKEALAVEQLRQVQNICDNIDMLTTYSDPDLAMLRTGTIPNNELVNSLASEVGMSVESMGITTTETIAAESTTSTETAENTTTENNNQEEVNSSDVANANTEGTNVNSENLLEMTAADSNNTNQVINFSTTNSGEIVTDSKTVFADPNQVVKVNIAVQEPIVAETKPEARIAESTESIAEVPAETKPAVASPSAASSSSEGKSRGTSTGNAADYYYAMPEVVTSDLFARTPRAVYSESKPIPVDAAMPKGVYYKVQVGAFRNDIPQNLYDEFAPVCGEKLNNGITRYTAGFFTKFESADGVKKEIRSIGYSDAFVVAFRDGKRIPLYEAMGKTDGEDFAAAVEKEYIYGDKGEAPASASNVSISATSNASNASNNAAVSGSGSNSNASAGGVNTSYYKAYPNAAPATQVETITGLFFTVQVGVYSKPVPAKSLNNVYPLNSELTDSKKIRYTTGRYNSMKNAVDKRSEAKSMGIKDAFITAYYNGKRITLSEADRLLKEKGNEILIK